MKRKIGFRKRKQMKEKADKADVEQKLEEAQLRLDHTVDGPVPSLSCLVGGCAREAITTQLEQLVDRHAYLSWVKEGNGPSGVPTDEELHALEVAIVGVLGKGKEISDLKQAPLSWSCHETACYNLHLAAQDDDPMSTLHRMIGTQETEWDSTVRPDFIEAYEAMMLEYGKATGDEEE